MEEVYGKTKYNYLQILRIMAFIFIFICSTMLFYIKDISFVIAITIISFVAALAELNFTRRASYATPTDDDFGMYSDSGCAKEEMQCFPGLIGFTAHFIIFICGIIILLSGYTNLSIGMILVSFVAFIVEVMVGHVMCKS